ncbi:MAG: hypothetical protein EXX96DRAFT_473097 [Benjaminiella poitrasii]|nr:MAG: hypothetical protein EXX96DRAFT_473097 [Benjaminiella poitrasii]
MFVGDGGYGTGSTIKGHIRYGGPWKPRMHSNLTTVCLTNEHKPSQTCIFFFKKVLHPVAVVMKNNRTKIRINRGSFLCVNPDCVSVRSSIATHSRDAISAHAVAPSGIGTLLFGLTFPPFDLKPSQEKAEHFIAAARHF